MGLLKLDFQHATGSIVREDIIQKITGHDIVVFGAGESGSWARILLERYGLNVSAFCDNSKEKQGQWKNGVPIMSLEEAISLYPEGVVCLASMYWHDIKEQIRNYDSRLLERTYNILSAMNWETLGRSFFSDEEEYIKDHIAEFEELYINLDDEESRRVLQNILNFRLSRKDEYIENIRSNEKTYLDRSVLMPEDIESIYDGIIIDGGAFDGDTVRFFLDELSQNGKWIEIHAYEISEKNCKKIIKLDSKGNNIIKVYQNALWIRSGEKLALNGEELSGRVQQGEKLLCGECVNTICLDDYSEKKISFIKLDVEGTEREVLYGARNIIEQQHPIMAISVYHLQDDLICLSRIIKQCKAKYKLYLRHYLYSPGETVLYAIPG